MKRRILPAAGLLSNPSPLEAPLPAVGVKQ
jgi:hypothetical protein